MERIVWINILKKSSYTAKGKSIGRIGTKTKKHNNYSMCHITYATF